MGPGMMMGRGWWLVTYHICEIRQNTSGIEDFDVSPTLVFLCWMLCLCLSGVRFWFMGIVESDEGYCMLWANVCCMLLYTAYSIERGLLYAVGYWANVCCGCCSLCAGQ